MTTEERSIQIELPKAFYADHVSRDLPGGEEVSQTARKVTVRMTADEVAELLSDAEHYASEARHMGPEYFGLGASAAATVRAINRQVAAKLDALMASDRAAATTYYTAVNPEGYSLGIGQTPEEPLVEATDTNGGKCPECTVYPCDYDTATAIVDTMGGVRLVVIDGRAVLAVRCPQTGNPEVDGCGALTPDVRDAEGLVDCANCGMWFDPDREAAEVSR